MPPGSTDRRASSNSGPLNSLNGVGSNSSGKKKGRERAANNMLSDYIRRGGPRPRIEIIAPLTRPTGAWSAEWVTELGILTRKWIPRRCHSWKDVDDPMKATLFEHILKRFDVDFSDAHVVSSVEGHAKKLYKEFRADLRKHYMGLPANIDKSQHPRDGVTQDDWAKLCVHWETDKFKARSLKNKKSRKGNHIPHRGGSRSFARSRVEMVNPVTNEEPDDITFYRRMHHNPTKGWTAPRAEEIYDKMVEMRNASAEEGSSPKSVEEIREAVLGVRPGYTPGLGYGVVPRTRRAEVPPIAAAAARTEMEQLKTRAENAEHELQQLREQHEQLKEQQSVQQRQLDYIMSQIGRSPAS